MSSHQSIFHAVGQEIMSITLRVPVGTVDDVVRAMDINGYEIFDAWTSEKKPGFTLVEFHRKEV